MASEWREATLGEVASNISRSFDLRNNRRAIFLNTGDVQEGRFLHDDYSEINRMPGQAKKALANGDILFSEIRPANGRFAFVDFDPTDYVVSTKFMVIRPRDESVLLPEFLYLILTQKKNLEYCQLIAESRSGTFPQITFDSVDNIPIPLPPIKIQRRLVEFKKVFDDKIELNRQMNRTLEAMARALFKSWFVDFDPVRAKMRGEQPEGMDAETAGLFPDELVEVDGREVPKGWEVEQVKNTLDLNYGKTLKAEQRSGGENPVYGSNGIIGFHKDYLVKGPGIVVGRKGNPGTVTWASRNFFPIDTTFFVVRKREEIPLSHIFYTLESLNLPNLGADSAVPGLNRDAALLQPYLVAPSKINARFDVIVQSLQAKIDSNIRESAQLAQLRDALLPRLLAGEIDVSGWEADH